MSALPRYARSWPGRFDFRVPDGAGNFEYPDWDDPDLKVEFIDAGGTVRATALVGGELALVQGDDYDASANPDGGKYVAAEGIDLAGFALGVAEARIYARVGDVDVEPYPTPVAAFEVVEDAGEGPLYSSVSMVRQEAPGQWPDTVTDAMVTLAIADASRAIDAYLGAYYDTPFPDAGDSPPAPAPIENVCRKLAAHQCLVWMGRLNEANDQRLRDGAMSMLMFLAPSRGKTPVMRLDGYKPPLAVYQGGISRSDDYAAGELGR